MIIAASPFQNLIITLLIINRYPASLQISCFIRKKAQIKERSSNFSNFHSKTKNKYDHPHGDLILDLKQRESAMGVVKSGGLMVGWGGWQRREYLDDG
jgi:hypothetical protein